MLKEAKRQVAAPDFSGVCPVDAFIWRACPGEIYQLGRLSCGDPAEKYYGCVLGSEKHRVVKANLGVFEAVGRSEADILRVEEDV